MPDSTRIITDPEEISEILDKAIAFPEFGQYVKNNIPYNEYVFGIGKVKYTPIECFTSDTLVLLQSDYVPDDARKNPWFWGGAAWGGFSLYRSWLAFDQYNFSYWTGVNGKRYTTDRLIERANGKYYPGRWAYLNSAEKAAEKAKTLGKIANWVSVGSLIIPVASTAYKRKVNLEDSADFIFAAVSFVLGVGWVISGIYTVVDVVCVATTEKKAVTYAKDESFTRWVKFQDALKNWINSLVPAGRYIY